VPSPSMTKKKNRTKTSTQVSKQGASAQMSRQTTNASGVAKKKARNILGAGTGSAEHYKVAITNPFSTAALGVRVPDQFFAPTATLSLREVVTIQNNAFGTADCIFLPSVIQPVVSTRGSIAGGQSLTMGNAFLYAANGTIVNNPTALYGKVVNHRIVSWGLRIRNTSALTAAQGALTVSLIPLRDRSRIPQDLSIGSQTAGGAGAGGFTMGEWLSGVGIPNTGSGVGAQLDISALVDLPHHARYQGPQLSEETFEIHPKLVSPPGLGFRNSQDNKFGMDMQATTSAVYVQPGDASYLLCDGWTAVAIGYTGGSSTVASQSFEIEAVYHIEGSPNVSTGTVFITDSPISDHNPLGALVAQAALNSMPAFTKVAGAAMAAYRSFTK